MSGEKRNADLLYGVPAIAVYLDMRERQARHLCEAGKIPTYRIASTICASKIAIDEYLEGIRLEAAREAARQAAERERAKGARP